MSSRPPHLLLKVAGESLSLYPCGALWWPARQVLVVSDLHLEKGSFYAARGQMIPPYDTGATLARLAALMAVLKPAAVISLGDSLHDRDARQRMAEHDVDRVRDMTGQTDWVWIAGNHDPDPPHGLGGRGLAELELGALVFRHQPGQAAAPGEISGHLHPCARVAGRGGRVIRSRCFVSDGDRLVMPAYGAFTGGLNILDPAFQGIFSGPPVAAVLGRQSVYLISGERLVQDNPARLSQI